MALPDPSQTYREDKAGSGPASGMYEAQIGKALGIKPPAIWPLVVSALHEFGIDSLNVQIAAAATCQVECGFRPIAERRANPNKQPSLYHAQERYWPWHGRGLIQLTWERNYRAAGKALGIDLISDPDKALEPETSARVLAWFFDVNGVADAAEARDWELVRRRVNGGLNGWPEFKRCVQRLLEVV